MKESFKFEYKATNMFHDIQPAGLSVYGERGLAGRDGTSGSTLYFVNYVDITDTIKTNLLRNIQNSYTLDGSGQALREYQNNDLIICKVGQSIYNNVYKITRSQKTNIYNIEKVGQLIVRTNVKNIFDTINSVKLNRGEYKETTCHIPVNRSYEINYGTYLAYRDGYNVYSTSTSTTAYSDALRSLFGFSLHPTITITDKTNAENYNFYLKIYIKNTKSILGRNFISIRDGYTNANTASSVIRKEPVTVENNIDIISFDKVIEIPVTKYYRGTQGDEIIDTNYNEVFLSDMGCDKLHPSLNNYSSSFFDPYRNRGYMTAAKDSNLYPFHAFSFSFTGNKYIINGQTLIKPNRNKDILESILSKQSNAYVYSSDVIQYSKDPVVSNTYCRVNFRSGESAYFSGMLSNTGFPPEDFETINPYTRMLGSLSTNSFDQYVAAQRSLNPKVNEVRDSNDTYAAKRRKYVMDYVCSEMNKFILNEDNVFELICIDKKSGRTRSKIYTLNQLQ